MGIKFKACKSFSSNSQESLLANLRRLAAFSFSGSTDFTPCFGSSTLGSLIWQIISSLSGFLDAFLPFLVDLAGGLESVTADAFLLEGGGAEVDNGFGGAEFDDDLLGVLGLPPDDLEGAELGPDLPPDEDGVVDFGVFPDVGC